MWPLPGVSAAGKPTPYGSFGARRPKKRHPGVDLGAPEGTPVTAPEDLIVTAHQGWAGPRAVALLGHTQDGRTLVFGALAPEGRAEVGEVIGRGEPVGVVGRYPGGDSMLHLEVLWRADGTPVTPRQRKAIVTAPWAGDAPPPGLLDAGEYRARMEGWADA